MNTGKLSHLTAAELVSRLHLRDDLTSIEHELLDRLTLALLELSEAEAELVEWEDGRRSNDT